MAFHTVPAPFTWLCLRRSAPSPGQDPSPQPPSWDPGRWVGLRPNPAQPAPPQLPPPPPTLPECDRPARMSPVAQTHTPLPLVPFPAGHCPLSLPQTDFPRNLYNSGLSLPDPRPPFSPAHFWNQRPPPSKSPPSPTPTGASVTLLPLQGLGALRHLEVLVPAPLFCLEHPPHHHFPSTLPFCVRIPHPDKTHLGNLEFPHQGTHTSPTGAQAQPCWSSSPIAPCKGALACHLGPAPSTGPGPEWVLSEYAKSKRSSWEFGLWAQTSSSNPNGSFSQLGDSGQLTFLLCASVSSVLKWG